jgi:hypothetical protein
MDATSASPLLRSFERHLCAANRAPTTVSTYLHAVRQAHRFLHARGKTFEAATRADLEAFMLATTHSDGSSRSAIGAAFAIAGAGKGARGSSCCTQVGPIPTGQTSLIGSQGGSPTSVTTGLRDENSTRRAVVGTTSFDGPTSGSMRCHRAVTLSPPSFVFGKGPAGRDVVFLGLAAPGAPDVTPRDDLVAVWKTLDEQRFQNYRAIFTVLDVPVVSREWIRSILAGDPLGRGCPRSWQRWVEVGVYRPLVAERVRRWRKRAEQLPTSHEGKKVLQVIYEYFRTDPVGFEACAARLWQMHAPRVSRYDLTRPSRDGGRDAIGFYTLGPIHDSIQLDFALEAKCFAPTTPVGVEAQSRLISRIRPRQFGVLVTTSYVAEQAYRELRDDEHPVVVLAGRDLVEILKDHQLATPEATSTWLQREFPRL